MAEGSGGGDRKKGIGSAASKKAFARVAKQRAARRAR